MYIEPIISASILLSVWTIDRHQFLGANSVSLQWAVPTALFLCVLVELRQTIINVTPYNLWPYLLGLAVMGLILYYAD